VGQQGWFDIHPPSSLKAILLALALLTPATSHVSLYVCARAVMEQERLSPLLLSLELFQPGHLLGKFSLLKVSENNSIHSNKIIVEEESF